MCVRHLTEDRQTAVRSLLVLGEPGLRAPESPPAATAVLFRFGTEDPAAAPACPWPQQPCACLPHPRTAMCSRAVHAAAQYGRWTHFRSSRRAQAARAAWMTNSQTDGCAGARRSGPPCTCEEQHLQDGEPRGLPPLALRLGRIDRLALWLGLRGRRRPGAAAAARGCGARGPRRRLQVAAHPGVARLAEPLQPVHRRPAGAMRRNPES
jgi:hypothetical protein